MFYGCFQVNQITKRNVLVNQFVIRLELTCDEVGVVELADGISLVPRDAVSEVPVEHREAFLRQYPCVADVYLSTKKKRNIFFQNGTVKQCWLFLVNITKKTQKNPPFDRQQFFTSPVHCTRQLFIIQQHTQCQTTFYIVTIFYRYEIFPFIELS